MRILEIEKAVSDEIRKLAEEKFGIRLEKISCEAPPRIELGDLALPVAFEIAKQIKQKTGEKKNPRDIAETLKSSLSGNSVVERIETAGAGYLNIFYNRAEILAYFADAPLLSEATKPHQKVCVEHTSVNPNKAAHIGHVRNAVLGDTFARLLKAVGKRVEVQNYIDNTGVQVADTVVGFVYLEKMNLQSIIHLDESLAKEGKSFDYYCWDLYSKVGKAYESDENLKEKRQIVLHLIERGGNEVAEIADYVAMRNVQCLLETMEKINIRYDLLPRESEILHLGFWQKAFEEMKSRGVIRYETEGKRAGCWVMPLDSHEGTEEHDADKILVRSNGTVTYTGKDIAYQMWKLGLLGLDFNYRVFHTYADGKKVWVTSTSSSENGVIPEFGKSEIVYNVIDSRQSYPQEVVKRSIAAIFPEKGEQSSIHLAYEMVALSSAAAEELGFQISEEDRKKPFIEMSGRKGLGVKANDLINLLESKALVEVEKRHADISKAECLKIARKIAVGALRYLLLKYTRNTIVVFDFKEALSFEGETGVFCQYSAVRANAIFKKLAKDELKTAIEIVKANRPEVNEILKTENEIWSLLMQAFRLEEIVHNSVNNREPAILAKYCFNLAKTFNLFYHNHRIITESNQIRRAVLIVTADIVRRTLTSSLDLMGIPVPERM
ncbi:MAG: arginine--tRNA ligase [Acidobacteriota bacterium]|nr:arginine--tRNA ligase [Pyrinomonadaceae bacterium]MDW8304599.1 arginine--tRNA ligase [Acidobacteriota bacterium]